MSTDSLAVFRRNLGPELRQLADEHLKHDLEQSDRDNLRLAASAVQNAALYGSAIGLTLGTLLAYRIRANRARLFAGFRKAEQPVSMRFADGREQAVPDFSPAMRPSLFGNVATFVFVGFGGLFLGGEAGLLTGSYRARRFITADPQSRERIDRAFRGFQADALRAQADLLERSGREGRAGEEGEGTKWL